MAPVFFSVVEEELFSLGDVACGLDEDVHLVEGEDAEGLYVGIFCCVVDIAHFVAVAFGVDGVGLPRP